MLPNTLAKSALLSTVTRLATTRLQHSPIRIGLGLVLLGLRKNMSLGLVIYRMAAGNVPEAAIL